MKTLCLIIGVISLVLLGCFPYYQRFEPHDSTVFLEEGQCHILFGPLLTIDAPNVVLTIDLEVLSGGNVDLYIMDEYSFHRYDQTNEQDFYYLIDVSRLNCRRAHFSYEFLKGKYYIVIDNIDNKKTPRSAKPIGSIKAKIRLTRSP